MSDHKLSSKNQISVPREVRDALDIGPGDHVRFMVFGDRVELVKPRPIAELAGMLYRPGRRAITLEEMSEAGPEGLEDEGEDQA
jgi:AbrB family looped-hinge helix DNA binding protein